MEYRELAVTGAYAFVPEVLPDARGGSVSPYRESVFTAAVGRPFPVAEIGRSVSRRGVVRGVHYTLTPPGTARYVHCAAGRALDVAVDLRAGSPTFGRWEAVELSGDGGEAVYLPPGVGHAFTALEDGTVMCHLLSREHRGEHELTLSYFDHELGLPLPVESPLVSDRDRRAPTLAEAAARGLLPRY
ncbi:dTDP-4-dehydrorhamnose 3,5-epimerase family protein [Streptosporangium sp. NPDC004379]|uniref:dTDP-4-dehydrorhamnose 3,5-epimerase family protein n=1 Tax=Streptosporangium sp. NPDC004379 TaxID=3366189 RepID=UPI0036A60A1C